LSASRWFQRRYPTRSLIESLRPSRLNIGERLTACFVAISVLMVIGDVVAMSQFRILRDQVQEVTRIDQRQVAVLRVHADLLSLRDNLRGIIATRDAKQFASEAGALRDTFLADLNRAKQALTAGQFDAKQSQNTLLILETVANALPTQIDTLTTFASNGDWDAVHLRFENQLQGLGTITSGLVDKVDAEVANQRTVAFQRIDRIQRWLLVLLPITAVLTLVSAGALGVLVTRSITRPLKRMDRAAQALACGDFQHEIDVQGTDELARLAAAFKDASRRLRTLYDALRSNELRFRSLIEHSSDLIATLDSQSKIRYVSPSSKRVIGYMPELLLGLSFYDFIHPDDVSTAKIAFEREPSEATQTVEFRFRHADGQMRILEAAGRSLLTASEVGSIVVNARDVTERRNAEEALYRSEEKYRAFFERNAAGSYISTPGGSLLTCNPAFLRMFGFSHIEEVDRTNFAQLYSSGIARQEFLRQLKDSGSIENYEREYRRKDGRPLFVIENAFGRFDSRGELVEICGFLIDETLRRRTEEQLRHAQKIEAVGRLAGAVAHDFNNLLGVIIGYGQLLVDDPNIPANSRQYIEQVFKAGVHGGDLTRQLLAFSRKQVLHATVLDLNDVIGRLEKMLLRLVGEDISIRTVLARDLAAVRADATQIEQVIINLAVNARDAMPQGGKLTISTASVDVDDIFAREHAPMKPGKYARIAVTDTGVGIDRETLTRIFEPFFSTKGEKGTGLGLATVYGIVKQSGGFVWADSELGKGTTFSVYLQAASQVQYRSQEQTAEGADLRGSETILLVEDAVALRVLTRELLEQNGYRVLEAQDVGHAIHIADMHHGKISLLLTDVVMPKMSGRLLAERLTVRRPEMKVLYMSGYTDDAILRHGILHERTPFLEKPFTREALIRKVREVLEGPQTKAKVPAA
jgi:two-component system cell cycle sensor histidine kinase/response regulator CckA